MTEIAPHRMTDVPFFCCDGPVVDLSHSPEAFFTTNPEDYDVTPRHLRFPALPPTPEQTLLDEIYAETNVAEPLDVLRWWDPATLSHVQRVGLLAGKAALQIGLTLPEAKIIMRAGLLHDYGKAHPEVQQAIHSPKTFVQDPSLFQTVRKHPWYGVQMLTPYGHSGNVLQIVGNHHSLQGERSYGVFSELYDLPERDGRRPSTKRALHIVAACDVFDALWLAPLTAERAYQRNTGERYRDSEQLAAALGSLHISDAVRQIVYGFATEPSGFERN